MNHDEPFNGGEIVASQLSTSGGFLVTEEENGKFNVGISPFLVRGLLSAGTEFVRQSEGWFPPARVFKICANTAGDDFEVSSFYAFVNNINALASIKKNSLPITINTLRPSALVFEPPRTDRDGTFGADDVLISEGQAPVLTVVDERPPIRDVVDCPVGTAGFLNTASSGFDWFAIFQSPSGGKRIILGSDKGKGKNSRATPIHPRSMHRPQDEGEPIKIKSQSSKVGWLESAHKTIRMLREDPEWSEVTGANRGRGEEWRAVELGMVLTSSKRMKKSTWTNHVEARLRTVKFPVVVSVVTRPVEPGQEEDAFIKALGPFFSTPHL